MVITIEDARKGKAISEELKKNNIKVISVEDVFSTKCDKISANRSVIADYHRYEMQGYFEKAESEGHISLFWGEGSTFRPFFDCMDLTHTIELACGKGRHVAHYINRAETVTLVDILAENIRDCQRRFSELNNINYLNNNGYDLHELNSESYTALFTYDAMVHFEMMDIFNYLKETYRVLKIGGKALFHHSNNAEDYRTTFLSGTYGRNYMSKSLFAHLADRAGLTVIEQSLVPCGDIPDLDCLTLVVKD